MSINVAQLSVEVMKAADALDAQAHHSNMGLKLSMEEAARKGRDFALALDRVKAKLPKPKN